MSLASLSLLLMPSAQAQYSGGGWTAVPCDASGNILSNPSYNNDGYIMGGTESGEDSTTCPLFHSYDTASTPYNNTPVPSGIGNYGSGGNEALVTNGSDYYWYGQVYGTNTYATQNGAETVDLNGQLVYYFKEVWQGSGAPTTPMPDHIDVRLKTRVWAFAYVDYYSSTQTSGLSAQATASDGDPFNESATASANSPDASVLYQEVDGSHLVRASVSGGIAEVYLNGKTHMKADNTVPYGVLSYPMPSDPSYVWGTVTNGETQARSSSLVAGSVRPFNIQLVQPNPNTDPTLGDGTNQFVYSADTPDGYLYIPGAIQVVGGTHADAQFLLDNNLVDLKIENSPVPNTFVHQWAISGNTIYVNTPQNTDDPYPGYQFNHWIFKGLPTSFSTVADGNHNVNLYVQGAKTQTAKIQTFYSATASNYPQAVSDYDNYGYYLPNWFNYFEQAYPNTTTYDPNLIDLYGNPVKGAVAFAQCAGDYDTSVVPNRRIVTESITKMAGAALTIGQTRGIPVFEVSSNTNYLDYIGQLYVKGIYSYLYVDAHEQEHNALQISGDCFVPAYGGSSPPFPPTDSDGDWLIDSAEAKYHLNPRDPDTTGYYTDQNKFPESFGQYMDGDTEAVCDIAGIHAIASNPNAWQQDWSDSGVQYGPRPPYSNTFFPYEYASSQANLPHSSSLPSYAKTSLP